MELRETNRHGQHIVTLCVEVEAQERRLHPTPPVTFEVHIVQGRDIGDLGDGLARVARDIPPGVEVSAYAQTRDGESSRVATCIGGSGSTAMPPPPPLRRTETACATRATAEFVCNVISGRKGAEGTEGAEGAEGANDAAKDAAKGTTTVFLPLVDVAANCKTAHEVGLLLLMLRESFEKVGAKVVFYYREDSRVALAKNLVFECEEPWRAAAANAADEALRDVLVTTAQGSIGWTGCPMRAEGFLRRALRLPPVTPQPDQFVKQYHRRGGIVSYAFRDAGAARRAGVSCHLKGLGDAQNAYLEVRYKDNGVRTEPRDVLIDVAFAQPDESQVRAPIDEVVAAFAGTAPGEEVAEIHWNSLRTVGRSLDTIKPRQLVADMASAVLDKVRDSLDAPPAGGMYRQASTHY